MRQHADEMPELPQSRQRGSIIPANFSGGNCEGFMPDQGHESRHAPPVFRDLGATASVKYLGSQFKDLPVRIESCD